MSRPLRLEFPGAVWHLYNRGVNRQDIFFDDGDRHLFLHILERTIRRYGWLVHAWVQMTNHVSLLVETPRTNLSAGMRGLDRDYAGGHQQTSRAHGPGAAIGRQQDSSSLRTGSMCIGRWPSSIRGTRWKRIGSTGSL